MTDIPTPEGVLPEPPERASVGRYAAPLWSYKGEVSEWPIIANRYAKDLLLLAADTIENWPDSEPRQDEELVKAIRKFAE